MGRPQAPNRHGLQGGDRRKTALLTVPVLLAWILLASCVTPTATVSPSETAHSSASRPPAITPSAAFIGVGDGGTVAPPTPSSTPPEPSATATGVAPAPTPTASPMAVYTFRVVKSYPHDTAAFTQGLVFDRGVLYESTGLHGRSSLRQVDLESGAVLQIRDLAADYFGEGLAAYDGRLAQLTWQSGVGFVYDRDSFELLDTFQYPGEGWGLTYDGQHLILSDGSAILRFLNPETFAEVRRLEVRDGEGQVMRLNELEWVEGEIYANVWLTDLIARINPHDGRVTGWIDLSGLLGPEDRGQPVDVLNGIAYQAESGRLFVTGKLWPKLYEIVLVPAD